MTMDAGHFTSALSDVSNAATCLLEPVKPYEPDHVMTLWTREVDPVGLTERCVDIEEKGDATHLKAARGAEGESGIQICINRQPAALKLPARRSIGSRITGVGSSFEFHIFSDYAPPGVSECRGRRKN